MSKGDRLILKADPDDGTTPVANLLLDALSMASLSGLELRTMMYLWRRTYGWQGNSGRVKKRGIALPEWTRHLNATTSRVSKALKSLASKNIIKRQELGVGKGYVYEVNTHICQWNSDSIDLSKLSNLLAIVQTATLVQTATVDQNEGGTLVRNAREPLSETTTPLATDLATPKESIKKVKEKGRNRVSPTPEENQQVKDLFTALKERRGYNSPKAGAEAKAIRLMLKEGYTASEILGCHAYLNSLPKKLGFEFVSMMWVHREIGEFRKSRQAHPLGKIEYRNL